ncbi:hypothetical protein RHS04_07712 [Rhizoctonia solani]|uniref:Uncharacterized protein n=1 Tax=Rhizoctonia solani TaxID=456999 RepID=A0A8H7H1S9_9AGAM|nr:hypothetical protein RHS04_07712 [Rhizoctonia solani]
MTDIHTIPNEFGLVDWFGIHDCRGQNIHGSNKEYRYEFNVTRKFQHLLPPISSERNTLNIWMGDPSMSEKITEIDMAPYLSDPIIPDFGWHTVYKTRYAKRRCMISSPLIDSITGSDPTYSTTFFFPAYKLASPLIFSLCYAAVLGKQAFQVANSSGVFSTEVVATGLIWPPVFLESSEKLATSELKPGQAPKDRLCEITEDYRVTNSFDMFASIGGLLALLQGVHILLFGRPLFWGMFGAKAITPFGMMGNLATKSFKKRLQERYHLPRQGAQANPEQLQGGSRSRDRAGVDIDMTQFLLDFVIDMGPASVPDHKEEDKNRGSDSESDEGIVECKPLWRLGDIEGATEVTQFQWADSGKSEATGSQAAQ